MGDGMEGWRPLFGAVVGEGGTTFRVWAPRPGKVELLLREPGERERLLSMERDADLWTAFVPGVGAGARYGYLLDGRGPFPDPCARRQPEGPTGLSEVVDPHGYPWGDDAWQPPPPWQLAIYELHVGTFTGEGTYAAAARHLPALRDLGFTAVELMPVATFEGRRGWGYDPMFPCAPHEAYGAPDELRRFVDTAHQNGLAVILDVVFNHLAPTAEFFREFSDEWFCEREGTPWGPAPNFEGRAGLRVREHVAEWLLHWVHEYHVDGFRLDATHAIDERRRWAVLGELRRALERHARAGTRPYLIAETPENEVRYLKGEERGGVGCDAVWADDFRHALVAMLEEGRHGRLAGFGGSAVEVARTIEQGWLFEGQRDPGRGGLRGTAARRQPPYQFVYALEHHDHVGNVQLGERLAARVGRGDLRAATMLLLLLPHTPLVFQGQEFASTRPFFFFAEPRQERVEEVRRGRLRELRAIVGTEAALDAVPPPDHPAAFARSTLDWGESEWGYGRLHRAFVRQLLALRHEDPVLAAARQSEAALTAWAEGEVVLVHIRAAGSERLLAANFGHRRRVELPLPLTWRVAAHSNDPTTGGNGVAPTIDPEARRAMLPAHCAAYFVPAAATGFGTEQVEASRTRGRGRRPAHGLRAERGNERQ